MSTPNHRKQRANNSSEHILDTYVDLLIHTGERAATLDAVATAAKVSKGGLLYHSPPRRRSSRHSPNAPSPWRKKTLRPWRRHPKGQAPTTSTPPFRVTPPFDRALIALSRLAQNNNELAQQTLARVQEGWHALVLAELGDEQIARTVLLLGDGMYYNAALGGDSASPQRAAAIAADRAALERALQVLKAAAR